MDDSKDSQQEPNQDSGLQTPQPDQPMPTEAERHAEPDEQADQPGTESADADQTPEQPRVDVDVNVETSPGSDSGGE